MIDIDNAVATVTRFEVVLRTRRHHPRVAQTQRTVAVRTGRCGIRCQLTPTHVCKVLGSLLLNVLFELASVPKRDFKVIILGVVERFVVVEEVLRPISNRGDAASKQAAGNGDESSKVLKSRLV